jgi:hypothetical protein
MIMTHIYAVHSPIAKRRAQRKDIVATVKILRNYEDKKMVEERIDKHISDLHSLWFPLGRSRAK